MRLHPPHTHCRPPSTGAPRLVQVLRSISEVFGQDLWFSTVLVLTRGASAPPDNRWVRMGGCADGWVGLVNCRL